MFGRAGCFGVLPVAFSLSLAACGGASAPGPQPASAGSGATSAATRQTSAALPADRQALVDAARKEGKLVLISSDETIGGPEAVNAFQAGFNQLYGLNTQIEYTPGPSMPEVTSKVIQEYKAGRPASTDLLINAEAHVASSIQAGAIIPVQWSAWAGNVKDERLLAPDGVAVEFSTAEPGITYNTKNLTGDLVPQTLQDLLRPQLKGRIASTPYAGIFADYASPEIWGEQKTLEYLKQFVPQVAGLLRAGEVTRLSSGEFDVLAVNTDSATPARMAAQGAPIVHVIPTDAATLQFRYASVPKNAAHPATAELFINYLLSRAGQDTLYRYTFSDHYLVPGSHAAAAIEKVEAAGVKLHPVDVQFLLRNDAAKLDAFNKQATEMFQRKS
jgi:iron(III) transport system substrate-binding protein